MIMKRTLLAVLVALALPLQAQTPVNVDLTEMVRELQQWQRADNKMKMMMWLPTEYWRIAIAANKQLPQDVTDEIERVLGDYVLILACDLAIKNDASMDFVSEVELRQRLSLYGKDGTPHPPLKDSEIDQEAMMLASNIKPVFSQMLGQFGRGMQIFFFHAKDANGALHAEAMKSGELRLRYGAEEFRWTTPLATLLPPKACPVDKASMKGNWTYCPFHGNKLEN